MYKLVIILIVGFSFTINADPAPFGLEIGKATISDMKDKYNAKFTDKNVYSHGDMYSLDVKTIGIEGIQSALTIFDKDKRLLAVLTTFHKNKFDYLYSTLKKKYKLNTKNIPFVGNKSAKFSNGNSLIFLDSPHLSFQMEMNYVNKVFWKNYQDKQREKERQQKKKEQSKL